MSVWRYTAVHDGSGRKTKGVVGAVSLEAARDSLRHAGLRPLRIRLVGGAPGGAGWFRRAWCAYLRRRRASVKAEAFDALATLVRSGQTPVRALRVLAGSRADTSGVALLARTLGDRVAEGEAFSLAAEGSAGWFDEAECAVLAAGERAGELDRALDRLAARQARSCELGARLAGVMLYPVIVTAAGLGVAGYLSVYTLPKFAGVLGDAGVEVPALTLAVMRLGSAGVGLFPLAAVVSGALSVALVALAGSGRLRVPDWVVGKVPVVLRRVRTAESFLVLAELTESGLTPVESVRIAAPMSGGLLGGALAAALRRVGDRVEQGVAFDAALDDGRWFTEEHRALLAGAAESGEMSRALRRLGERDRRSAHRLIDRAAGLLEPGAIVLLALFIGTIVLAAVLPMVRMQEIIG